jgi:hypothetical protein
MVLILLSIAALELKDVWLGISSWRSSSSFQTNTRFLFTTSMLECLLLGLWGPNSLRCTKILSQCYHFLSFLPSHFLPCKNTFMDDYDGI